MLINFLVAFGACVIGSICGLGGGVLIKPILDAVGLYPVAVINFMSGCTVLGMSLWNVGQSIRSGSSTIAWKKTTLLAIGAAAGGVVGKILYERAAGFFAKPDTAGSIQAILLIVIECFILVYTRNKEKIQAKNIGNSLACIGIGFLLGNVGSFLGIGGGALNVAVLCYFFSMRTKEAAQNSLYIIVFSQATGIMQTLGGGSGFNAPILVLTGMIFCGIIGSEVGRRLNRRLSDGQVTHLLESVLGLIILISGYNFIKLAGFIG